MSLQVNREAARVILLDQHDRVLMMRGHDPDEPQRSWWFVPGGGLEEGETHRQAASRELVEETGFSFEPAAFAGPIWHRTAIFDFAKQSYVQREQFFVVKLAGEEAGKTNWSATEEDCIDEIAWMSIAELSESSIEVFPVGLATLLQNFLPWDGDKSSLPSAIFLGVESE